MESKGVIRRTIEEGDTLLVSFATHDGYFRVDEPILKERVLQAQRSKREISFTFDQSLRILAISSETIESR